MGDKRPVFTENFSSNLTALEAFLQPHDGETFQQLLETLFDRTIPTLCRFPESGRLFLTRSINSTKGGALVRHLRRLLKKNDDLREYVLENHLVLYVVRRDRIVFLSIKHHRQFSFDLKRFWAD